ncbi:hypothetical protein F5Y05DRAFT_381758 [Hypoxylon sp. FL0543]|nr:hypothetical protein F5Y05DRAFT_381758 [Hypoxylon sp. FL0543]
MTESSPEVLATANLTPISPAPLHPSSPIVVPSLQDQADTLYGMSLSNGGSYHTAPTTAMDQPGNPANHNGITGTSNQDGTHGANVGNSNQLSVGNVEGGDDDGSIGGQEANNEPQQNVKDISDTSKSQTSHSEVAISSHDVSPSVPSSENVYQPVPKSNPTEAQESQELQQPPKPQEQAIVPVKDDPDAAQRPTESSAEKSDPSSATNEYVDIQSLVDKIIGNSSTSHDASSSISSSVSLPPRPPVPEQPPQAGLSHQPAQPAQPPHSTAAPSTLPPPPGTYPTGAPGTVLDSYLPPPPAAMPNPLPSSAAAFDPSYHQVGGQSQIWEAFLSEERRYVSDAKWDRFPEGSRLFIGNLSSDRVSKREVFDIFSKYGRLAQISLKQAYGFVQYHTLAEGQAAMDHLQGIEVKGRKIHLEFSRTQKKDGDGEKRGNRGKRDNDRHDGARGRRDDYRPGRQPSPRRGGSHRQPAYDGSRGYHDDYSARARSRSPGYGRRDSGHYRHRSPSPYRHQPPETDLGIPRRYGADIPDVQFLLLQEVEREFVSWLERAFVGQGLKVQVMFLHPHFPREAVIQRQVMEGVHAVVELDLRAQQTGTISLQVFNRSGGHGSVRFDQYQDLNPTIAAQLVSRAKSQAQPLPPYGGHPQYPQAPPVYLPPSYPSQGYATTNPPMPRGGTGAPLDNATLQMILGSLPSHQGASQGYGGARPPNVGGPNQPSNAGYLPGPTNSTPSAPPPGDPSRQVQDIMATLSRFRQ